MSLPLYVAAVLPITTLILILINLWWDRRWKLRNLPTPVCFLPFLPLQATASSLSPTTSILTSILTLFLPSQAGPSLVWGHEKTEFEDDQGWQWRAWFNECGRAFKIKAAWGHPDIVSNILYVPYPVPVPVSIFPVPAPYPTCPSLSPTTTWNGSNLHMLSVIYL